jgi:hypothetical protein
MINEKNILIIDDDVVETSLKYKKWLEAEQEEEEGFNLNRGIEILRLTLLIY